MPRMTIVHENALMPDNRFVMPGAIVMDDEEIPVCWNGDYSNLLGFAHSLERQDDDVTVEVTFRAEWWEGRLKDHFYDAFGTIQPFEAHSDYENGMPLVITYGRLRGVHITLSPVWPYRKEQHTNGRAARKSMFKEQ